jgi:hypothetical protein
MAKTIQAFVARSFAENDLWRIQRILDFIKSFENIGFFTKSALPAEADRVSIKVQSLIVDSQVFIGFLTRKHPIITPGFKKHIEFFRGRSKVWTAPPWVHQESGFALAHNKKLIIYREEGVEAPALYGDVEYI